MADDLAKRIGNASRKARLAQGLTQERTAEQIGITVEFYSRIERGAALPSLSTFIRMAVVFGVSTDKLIGLTEDEDAQRIIKEFAAPPPVFRPEVERVARQLDKHPKSTVRVVTLIVNEIEKRSREGTLGRRRSRRDDDEE